MSFIVPERLYRTADGRLVRHGDPEGAFLAFPAGHELPDAEARSSGVLEFLAPPAEVAPKAAPRPQEKMAPAPANKAAAAPTSKGNTP